MLSSCLRHGRFKQFSRKKCLFVFATADLNSLQGTKPGLRNRTSNAGPGCLEADYLNPGLAQSFVSSFQLFGESFFCSFLFFKLDL